MASFLTTWRKGVPGHPASGRTLLNELQAVDRVHTVCFQVEAMLFTALFKSASYLFQSFPCPIWALTDSTQTGFHHVGQAGLELPTSGDPPALASKVLGLQA
ncbi:hypothetical protein AAY473_025136 [Plecturocebus cupreus]